MTNDFPTDPNAETIGLPSDETGKGSMPEPGKFVAQGTPTEIGRYKILGVIGAGGMGAVYEAMQEAPRRRVALKVIKTGAANDMALRRFHFEAQTLAKLSHPNIAQIYEAGVWDNDGIEVPFFAMEYVAGAMTLVDYANKRQLDLRDRLELFGKICSAVHHGHQKGVIHRDLKPDNILVDNKGEAKIIDFGVARATDADLAVTTMQTTMGQLIGTLQYMSPEQCDADPDRIDVRSDVYALGVILFQLLSGQLPYDLKRLAIHEAVRIIKEERPLTMSTVNLRLKGDIETVVVKSMEKDRERRYQSAAEFANDIVHFLNNEPIIARPLSISYQLRLFTKKYRRTCAAVILCAVSIVLGLVGTTWGMVEANRQRTIADSQRQIAEDRYDTVLNMSNDFVGEFYSGIVKLDAAMKVRKHVLDETLVHLEALRKSSGETPEVMAAIAKTYGLYGQYYFSIRAANLGEFQKAFDHFQTSLSMFNDLVEKNHSQYKYALAVSHLKISDLHKSEEKYGDSLTYLNDASQILQEYNTEHPEDEEKKIRAKSHIDLARIDVLLKLQQIQEAKIAIGPMLEERRLAANKSPRDLKLKRDYANVLQRAGSIYHYNELLPDSIEYYRLAKDIYIDLQEAEPENGRAPKDLGWGLYFLGEVQFESGDTTTGIDTLEEALVIFRDRCATFPEDSDARDNLLLHLGQFVLFCNRANALERAHSNCKDILIILQPVVEANPENYALSNVFSKVQEFLGETGTVASATQ